MAPKPIKTLDVRTRRQWRKWLDKHHDSESEIWLVFHKSHTGVVSLDTADAIEEALCFGWVDSIIRRLDDARYARKFTPRKPASKWSALNRRRYRDLKARGLLAPAGLERAPTLSAGDGEPGTIPGNIEKRLKATQTWSSFHRLAPSYQEGYVRWIESAKQENTKQRRLAKLIRRLEVDTKTDSAVPRYIEQVLKTDKQAWKNFQQLAPSYRLAYVRWIDSAIQPKTKERRLREAVGRLAANKKLGLK